MFSAMYNSLFHVFSILLKFLVFIVVSSKHTFYTLILKKMSYYVKEQVAVRLSQFICLSDCPSINFSLPDNSYIFFQIKLKLGG